MTMTELFNSIYSLGSESHGAFWRHVHNLLDGPAPSIKTVPGSPRRYDLN
jgi:hypothetical protein